jgi:hypothetical protein
MYGEMWDTGIGNYFLITNPIAQEIRARTDKRYCIKLKTSAHQRKQLPESRYNPQNGESISQLFNRWRIITKEITKAYKELKKLNTKRINNPINKLENVLSRHFSEKVEIGNIWRNVQHP